MKLIFNHRTSLAIVALVVITAMGLVGCSDTSDNNIVATDTQLIPSTAFTTKSPMVQSAMAIQNRHTPNLMSDRDVIGTGITLDSDGKVAIAMYVTSRRAMNAAPKELDGLKVVVHVTDRFVAMKGRPGGGGGGGGGGGTDHKAIQTPPVKMGTSGGWTHDLANGFCCGGTLGSLIQVGGQKRILSNYHVFEADIVNGGNGRTASTGDAIIQPGLIDVGCNSGNAQEVATLVVTSSLPGNNVDCSTATVISGMVDESGAILEIGTISSTTVGAFVGQGVKKSGRTTGLGRAQVQALNATVNITYENECAGGTAFTKQFTGQIVTSNKGSKFLDGGDSGSLMVEDVTNNPHAIGLLFAGSRSSAIANPIDDVLSFLGATMVGN